jgi:glycosyl transferase, family 25
MHVFLINLDRRPDRLLEMTRRLNAIGIEFTRVAAVDGRAIDVDAFTRKWIARWCIGGFPDPLQGAVGCILSHRKIWQKMIDEDIAQALIFEDDAVKQEWDPQILDIDLQAIGLDLLRLGLGRHMNLVTRRPLSPMHDKILGRTISYEPTEGTHAYIISKAGAKKCLAMKRIWFPLDHFVFWSFFYGVKTAVFMPPVFSPSGSVSNIQKLTRRGNLQKLVRYIKRLPLKLSRRLMWSYLKHFG